MKWVDYFRRIRETVHAHHIRPSRKAARKSHVRQSLQAAHWGRICRNRAQGHEAAHRGRIHRNRATGREATHEGSEIAGDHVHDVSVFRSVSQNRSHRIREYPNAVFDDDDASLQNLVQPGIEEDDVSLLLQVGTNQKPGILEALKAPEGQDAQVSTFVFCADAGNQYLNTTAVRGPHRDIRQYLIGGG